MQSDQSNASPSVANRNGRAFKISIVVALVVLLGVSATGLVLYQKQASETKKQEKRLEDRIAALEAEDSFAANEVDKDQYQAVFLTTGQVYFGKVTKITKETIKIEDIFYLNGGTVDETGNVPSGDATMVKLGKELHGPEDVMILERKNVSFWENLKPEGEVAKAIAEYKKSH